MMSTTHASAGVVLATPLLEVAPELAPVGALAAMAGGVLPDVDLFVGVHRRTLHFPVWYAVAAAPAVAIAAYAPGPATVAAALFLAAAALHSVSDWFGAGDELRPWERTSDRAVYLHPPGRWLAPKYWVRYDGAPEDLALSAALAVPGLLWFGSLVRALTLAGLAVAAVYVVLRKRVPDLIGL
jgi:hypothetical protein